MEMDFARPTTLSPTEALAIMSQFFRQEWKHLSESDIVITRSQTGVNNEVYFVTRTDVCPEGQTKGAAEPHKVVIRIYSSIMGGRDGWKERRGETGMKASEVEEILMLTRLSDRGLGPRLLGVFEGGRVEECLDVRKITWDEAYDEEVEEDIARNLAKIHATIVPLKKPSCDFLYVLRDLHSKLQTGIAFYENIGDEVLLTAVRHDYESDLVFLEPLLDWRHNVMVLMNWDVHMDNVTLLNKPQEGQLKTVIFDFEMGGYNIRGKDLGLWIMSRSGFFPTMREDRRLEDEEISLRFLSAYQRAIVTGGEFDDIDVNGKDSIDHLYIESLIGGVISAAFFGLAIAGLCATTGKESDVSEKMVPFVKFLFEGYGQCLKALKDKEPHYQKIFARD